MADEIIASPFAVIGSIGVISEQPNVYERSSATRAPVSCDCICCTVPLVLRALGLSEAVHRLRAAQRLRAVRPRATLPRETRANDASRSILDPTSPHDTRSVSSRTSRIGVISVISVIPEPPNVYERSASEQKSCLICSQLGCFCVCCFRP